jgi:hypothetical protein
MTKKEPGAKQGYETACEDIADSINIFAVDDILKRSEIEADAKQLSLAIVYFRELVYTKRNNNPFKKKNNDE